MQNFIQSPWGARGLQQAEEPLSFPFCKTSKCSEQGDILRVEGWTERGVGRTGCVSVCLQSQQPPPPSHHLSKPKGDAALKMRASVRVTRYLESWGAARPFAHLNQRESVSSSETLLPTGRRPKVGPLLSGELGQGQ
jgi:hypothetical protein